MATTDAHPVPQKNVAYRVYFPIYDNDGDLVAAATIDSGLASGAGKALYSGDAAAAANSTNSVTEVSGMLGIYFLDLTASEMNKDNVSLTVRTTTANAKNTPLALYPEEAGDIRVNLTQWSGTAPNALVSGRVDGSVGAMAADVVTAASVATDAVAELVSGVWNEDATGHQTTGTFGQAIGDPVADTNTIYKAVVTDAAGATVGVDVVAVKAETASIQADTDNMQTRLPAALVSGRMDSDVGAMQANTVTASALAADASTEIRSLASGTADSGTTTTLVDAARTEADADYWKGQLLVVTSGTIAGQARLITGFNATTDTLTVSPAFTAAVGTQTYEIWPLPDITRIVLSELAQAAPSATPALADALMLLYMALRNKLTTTATDLKVHNDAGTVIAKASLADDGTTFTRDEMATGP